MANAGPPTGKQHCIIKTKIAQCPQRLGKTSMGAMQARTMDGFGHDTTRTTNATPWVREATDTSYDMIGGKVSGEHP